MAKGSVGVFRRESRTPALLAFREWMADGSLKRPKASHSARLPLEIQAALREASLDLADLRFLAVGAGPGRFTGIRIAMGAVRALAFALDRPVYPVDSLQISAEPFLPPLAGSQAAALKGKGPSRPRKESQGAAAKSRAPSDRAGSPSSALTAWNGFKNTVYFGEFSLQSGDSRRGGEEGQPAAAVPAAKSRAMPFPEWVSLMEGKIRAVRQREGRGRQLSGGGKTAAKRQASEIGGAVVNVEVEGGKTAAKRQASESKITGGGRPENRPPAGGAGEALSEKIFCAGDVDEFYKLPPLLKQNCRFQKAFPCAKSLAKIVCREFQEARLVPWQRAGPLYLRGPV